MLSRYLINACTLALCILGSQLCFTNALCRFLPGKTLVWVYKISIPLLEIVLVLILWCLGSLSEKQVY